MYLVRFLVIKLPIINKSVSKVNMINSVDTCIYELYVLMLFKNNCYYCCYCENMLCIEIPTNV